MSTGPMHHVSMKCGNMWSHPNIEFHPFYGRQNFRPSWPSYLTLILHRVICHLPQLDPYSKKFKEKVRKIRPRPHLRFLRPSLDFLAALTSLFGGPHLIFWRRPLIGWSRIDLSGAGAKKWSEGRRKVKWGPPKTQVRLAVALFFWPFS